MPMCALVRAHELQAVSRRKTLASHQNVIHKLQNPPSCSLTDHWTPLPHPPLLRDSERNTLQHPGSAKAEQTWGCAEDVHTGSSGHHTSALMCAQWHHGCVLVCVRVYVAPTVLVHGGVLELRVIHVSGMCYAATPCRCVLRACACMHACVRACVLWACMCACGYVCVCGTYTKSLPPLMEIAELWA